MASIHSKKTGSKVNYPTRDGRPMGETDVHRDDMVSLIQALQQYYAHEPMVFVSGNLLLFYVEGDRRKHISPDVFVVFGVPKGQRLNYLVWEEGRAPEVVIELTSKTTRKEDLEKKFNLYQDVLQVREYFLFDPLGEYLKPSMQGHRLTDGKYRPIDLEGARMRSEVLGLDLERSGSELRLFNRKTGGWLPTADEIRAALEERESVLAQEKRRADALADEVARLKALLKRDQGEP